MTIRPKPQGCLQSSSGISSSISSGGAGLCSPSSSGNGLGKCGVSPRGKSEGFSINLGNNFNGISMVNIWLIMVNIWLMMVNNNLVGGFNPSEKYESQLG